MCQMVALVLCARGRAPPNLKTQRSPSESSTSFRMVDYSRFNGIGDSDDDSPAPTRAPAPAAPRPPPNVMDDLEDYFRRMDERRAAAESEQAEAESVAPASVERFSDTELTALKTVQFAAGRSSYQDCSICLADFETGEEVVELPCAAKHLFHTECARAALSRSIYCPLCRVDVRTPVAAAFIAARDAAGATPDAPLSPRSLGFTRDGGVILRYEPNPAPEVPRPSYIPRALASDAGFVEIAYPETGVARVWRVPRQEEH